MGGFERFNFGIRIRSMISKATLKNKYTDNKNYNPWTIGGGYGFGTQVFTSKKYLLLFSLVYTIPFNAFNGS